MRAYHFLFLAIVSTSCNFYSFLDSPGNDDQHLSRARACLDRGDYSCALEHYALVSDAYKNTRESEIAFTIMAQNGVNFGAVLSAFGGGEGGKGITRLANRLIGTASSTVRGNFYTAYARNSNITGDTSLAGLVKFVSSISIAAAVLAESAGSDNVFNSSDLTTDPTGCRAAAASCTAPSNSLTFGTGAFTSSGVISTGNLGLLLAALNEADTALNQMGEGGSIGSGTGSFLGALGTTQPDDDTKAKALRNTLLNQNVGTQ